MQDRPSARELLDAVAAFIREEIVPTLEGRKRFHALVAENVCHIVAREITLAPEQQDREGRSLWTLLGKPGKGPERFSADEIKALNEELCRRIQAGEADGGSWREQALAHLRATVIDKLTVANPKLVG